MAEPEGAPARREALIIAADRYEDQKLRALRAPARDAEELARVLGDSEVGDFQVAVSLNEPDHVVRRRLSEFFRDRRRDDLLLLHVSCHGLKDEDGTLYFASSNTAVEDLEATAIASEFVNRQMTKSRSRRIVLLLDCCFGGAFARGMVHRAGESVAIKEEFEGQGRVVLTASRAMEYAFEGDSREGDAQPSIFTSAIVEGLESGEADRDGDSRVSIDELYDYVYDRVREATPNQTPSKWTFDVHGDLYVARSPFREPEPVPLPVELRAALDSPFANVRAGAVEELAHLLGGSDAGLAAAARLGLEEMAGDDSRRVSDAAARALTGKAVVAAPASVPAPPHAEPAPEQPQAPTASPPRRERERSSSMTSRVAIALARAAHWKDAIAIGGAGLLVLGYFRTASWDTAWYFATHLEEIWYLWSPLEAFGAAVLVAVAVLKSRRGGLSRESVDGLLLAVGLIAAAAMVAFVGSTFDFDGTAAVTALGAVAIAAAGVLGVVTRRAPEVEIPRRTVRIAAAGVAVGLSPLFVNLAEWSSSGLLEGWGGSYSIEVVAAEAAAMIVLLLLIRAPRARLQAGGALIALGALLALHYVGVMIQIAKYEGGDALRLGGVLGVAGALVLLWAGVSVLRFERRPGTPATVASMPAVEVPVPPATDRRALPVRLVAALALVGAVSFAAAIAVPFSAPYGEDWNALAVLSPFEAAGVSLAVLGAAVALLKGRIDASLATGLLVGFGVLATAASLATRRFVGTEADALNTVWARIPLGSVAILAAGLLCAWSVLRTGRGGSASAAGLWIGGAGAAFMIAALLVPYDGFSALIDDINAFVVVPLLAIAAAAVGLAILASRMSRQFASGMLLAVGVQATLHFVGLIVAAALAIGERGEVRGGGFLGLVGGLLVVVAGAYGARATRPAHVARTAT